MLNEIQNLEAVDAREMYPKEYITWREDPSNFCVNGVYPVRKLWETAREAWKEILLSPVSFLLIMRYFILEKLQWHSSSSISVLPGERFSGCDPQINVEGTNMCSSWSRAREVFAGL